MQLNQFDKILARFEPTNTEDLRDCCKSHIGKTYTFEALWEIDEDYCGGRYTGQIAMKSDEMCHWVPDEDLVLIDKVK